jgi:phosphatidylglycerol:prolipoprotein diacylglycerol transferase
MIFPLAVIPFPSIDPVLFRVGPIAIRWYGQAYLAGFLTAYLMLRAMVRSKALRITTSELSDLLNWLVIGVMAGGRTGWWIFYHRREGSVEPWYEPLAIWHGGMSFHGGLIGVLVALLIWSWKRRAPFWNLADCLALVAPLGLFFGRIANFINAELVGRPTLLPWGMIFPGDSIPRHPSQLYEAVLEGPALLLILWTVSRSRRSGDGQTAALFLMLYGVFRFGVEFTRQPDSQLGFIAFGWLTMGQLLSAVLVFTGIVVWRISHRARSTDPANDIYESPLGVAVRSSTHTNNVKGQFGRHTPTGI